MRADWIADALREVGLTVIEAPGWKYRGKAPFTPQVVVAHHTAGPRQGDAPSLNVCINGRSDLPGPLCHVLLSRSGVCHVIASGVANHAGPGSWKGVKGNSHALGIEAENTGRGEPWTPKQTAAFHLCAAVLLAGIGKDESSLCGHKEWTPRKIDPAGLDMDQFRVAVRSHLEGQQDMYSDSDRDRDERVAALLVRVEDIVSKLDDNANMRMAGIQQHTESAVKEEGRRITGEVLNRLSSIMSKIRSQKWWDKSQDT